MDEWTELAAKTFDFAATAKERFEKGSVEDKKTILRAIGSNLILKDRKLEINPRTPFLLIKEALSEINEPERIEPEEKIDNTLQIDDLRHQNPVWVSDGDRTRNIQVHNLTLYRWATPTKLSLV